MTKYSLLWTLLCLISVSASVSCEFILYLKLDQNQIKLHFCFIALRENDICTTPSGADGICIPFKKCPSVIKILIKISLFEDDFEFIKSSENGCNNNKPLVNRKTTSCQFIDDLIC